MTASDALARPGDTAPTFHVDNLRLLFRPGAFDAWMRDQYLVLTERGVVVDVPRLDADPAIGDAERLVYRWCPPTHPSVLPFVNVKDKSHNWLPPQPPAGGYEAPPAVLLPTRFSKLDFLKFIRLPVFSTADAWGPAKLEPGEGPPKNWPSARPWRSKSQLAWINALRESDPLAAALAEWLDDPSALTDRRRSRGRAEQDEETVLDAIRSLGYEPTNLRARINGHAGVKSEVRHLLVGGALTESQFQKAWERLRSDRRVAEGSS